MVPLLYFLISASVKLLFIRPLVVLRLNLTVINKYGWCLANHDGIVSLFHIRSDNGGGKGGSRG